LALRPDSLGESPSRFARTFVSRGKKFPRDRFDREAAKGLEGSYGANTWVEASFTS